MKFIEFQKNIAPLPFFSLHDARLVEPAFDRRRFHEWSKKGYIKFLTRGWYIFTDCTIDERMLDQMSNRLYSPSYISLETVLSRSGIIPDTVRAVTSVTTLKTRSIKTEFATFSYRTIVPRLFFGYDIVNGIKTACLEKALIDFFYLHPDQRAYEDFDSLRMDRQMITEQLDCRRFEKMLTKCAVQALRQRAAVFLKWMHNA